MNSLENDNKVLERSPTKQRTPRQLPCQKNVGIYFAQSKNTIELSSTLMDSSESDEAFDDDNEDELENSENDSVKKRKKRSHDPMTKKLTKIRKTFDSNIIFADEESKNSQETETQTTVSSDRSPKKISQDSLSSNIELTIKNKSSAIDNRNNKENIDSQATDALEGLDDLFEEEWSYKKDTIEDIDDLFQDDWSYENEVAIDFSTPRRCIIIDIIWDKIEMTLTLKDSINEISAIVKCYGIWRYTKIEPGEPIVVKAKKESKESMYWIVNNDFGWIINQPDTLISGFRKDIRDIKQISALLDNILNSKHAILMMYSNGCSRTDCKKMMQPSVAQIYKFVQRYIIGIQPEVVDQNFVGKIEKICDIEENIWLPSLGLKGKIDVTVEVSSQSKNKLFPGVERRILPLEIKTGRSSFSSEHQGQLILYTMMMNMTDRKVDSGLLLYLRENIMKEIVATPYSRRDLITMRNTVAYYATRQPIIVKENDQEKILPIEFPKPINHPACAKCPYNVLCCTYLNDDDKADLRGDHSLLQLSEDIVSHLSQDHIDYVKKWVSLLQLEEITDNQDVVTWKHVWTCKPIDREKKSSCISNLNLVSVVEKDKRFLHNFQRLDKDERLSEINFTDFCEQEYVIISTNKRINICSGFIANINSTSVSVHCEKDISKVYKNTAFHIDKTLSTNLLSQNMGQLGGLLDNHSICNRLREIVIDRRPATFETELPNSIMEIGEEILNKLNKNQKQAILKTLQADDYILIKGFPGTGKTQTLVALIELLVKLDKSVLVTAHTNTAVDNILLKLLGRKVDFIRLGSSTRIHPSLFHMVDDYVTVNCDSPESLHTLYCSKKVVAVTCYGATHPHLSRRKFDICIVDESTQVLQPTILRPLFCASKFVLVGDPEQLPPIARNDTARKMGMNESLFSRLDSDNNSVTLKLQYRMNSCIMNVANKLTYYNQLEVGNESIGKATLPITNVKDFESCERWLRKALSLRLKKSTIMLNTSATHHLTVDPALGNMKGAKNYWEAAIILRLVEVLINLGIDAQTIGVIAPYRAQVGLLRTIISSDIEVNTVDQYQGRDKSVIIYSCSKSIQTDIDVKEFDILGDQQRLTVAVTRAKHKLIIIGDLNTLERYNPFQKLLVELKKDDLIYDLKDGEDDFCFEDLIRLLY